MSSLDPTPNTALSLDGVQMRVVGTDPGGVVDRATLFIFAQHGAVVTATYAGGAIISGCLAGVLQDTLVEFRYAQVDREGAVHGGHSYAELIRLDDGRWRLLERFTWESRLGSGTNVLEEILTEEVGVSVAQVRRGPLDG